MDTELKWILGTVAVVLLLALALDSWQADVTIYASTCETSSGFRLPQSFCKAIVNYRFYKDN